MANKSKRRDFLKATTATGVGFWVSTRSAQAQNRSANERVNHAAIGAGGMGGGDVSRIAGKKSFSLSRRFRLSLSLSFFLILSLSLII